MSRVEPAPCDGVFPEDFYSTTNLETYVRLDARWIPVRWPEMDCGIVVDRDEGTAQTVPLIQVKAGDLIVVGTAWHPDGPSRSRPRLEGFRVHGLGGLVGEAEAPGGGEVARLMREARADGKKIVAVLGPAVVHTGAAPAFASLVAGGLDRRGLGRQRCGHPRHRVGVLQYFARHQPVRGRVRRGGPRAPSARHQPDPALWRDPPGRGARRTHLRPVVRDRSLQHPLRAGRAPSGTTVRSPTSSPTPWRLNRPCGSTCAKPASA